MDPNATLRHLRDALTDDRRADACDHATNLLEWLDRGGFLPDAWQPFAAATDDDDLVDSRVPNLRDCLTALADAIANDDTPPAHTSTMLRTFAHAVGNLEQQRDTLRADLADAINDHQSIRADRDELRLALDQARDEANRATRAADDYAQKAHDLERDLVAVQSDRDALAIIQLRGDVAQLEKEAAARIETIRAYRLELQRYAERLERSRREAENHAAAAADWKRIAIHYSSHLSAIHDTVVAARKEHIR